MAKKRIRLDEDDIIYYLAAGLQASGRIQEGDRIVGLEFKTRRIRRGGDYYKDGLEDDEYPPEGVEVVRWIKVLTDTRPPRREREEEQDGMAEQDAGVPGGEQDEEGGGDPRADP